MFPESSFAGRKYPTLHRAICAFRSLFTRALKVSGLNVIISPNCTHLKPLGLGKVAGFCWHIWPYLWRGLLVWFHHLCSGRSLLISFAGFTLCNSNSQMHRLALSHPWVMGVKAAAKKVLTFFQAPMPLGWLLLQYVRWKFRWRNWPLWKSFLVLQWQVGQVF